MNFTSFLQLMIGLIIAIFMLIVFIRKWNELPLILLPLIWYLPEQTSAGRLLENYMFIRWFTIVLIPIVILIEILRRRNLFKTMTVGKILPVIAFFVFFTAVSAIINDTSWIETIGYLAVYLRYPLFYILLINIEWEEKTAQKFVVLFLFLIFIQIPEVLYRHYALGITGDDITWSLGAWGTTNLGIYGIYASSIIVAHGLNTRFTLWHILGIILLFLFALFGEIKSIVIWLPMTILVTFYFYPFKTRVKKYSVIFIALLIGVIFFQIFYTNWQKLHGRNIATILQTTYLTLEGEVATETKYSAYRLGILLQVWEEVKTNNTFFIFGEGPGSSLVGNFFGRPGRITQVVTNTKDTPNQIASTILDVGIVGLILYYSILIVLLLNIRKRVLTNNNNPSKLFNILKTAYPGMIFYYLFIGPLYHPVWRFDAASFIFYFVSAEIYRRAAVSEPK
ncbi:MAG: hypothetical protein ABIL20_05665 [candidate division WOR-3 bacterium]